MEINAQIKTLHRKYIREEEPNTVILNLKNWPNVDWCYIHKDKKGWGTYIRDGKFYNIGRNGNFTLNPIFSRDEYCILRKSFKVITDNPEVKRVYENYYNNAYSIYSIDLSFKRFLKINPKLFTNLWDYYNVPEFQTVWNNGWDRTTSILCYIEDFNAETIKDAFGLSMKYFKVVARKGGYYLNGVKTLKGFGYSPEEVSEYIEYMNYCPNVYLNNRKILARFCEINNLSNSERSCKTIHYRDYLRMISQFPTELKKDFPLCPQDIDKYHDRALKIYNRYQQQILESQQKVIGDRYINNVYSLVKEYEFSNDEYVIVAPKSVFELTTEGRTLNHCVGSYVQSVSNGKEYILFLRKKENQDIPFFTINITPDKEIRQIHGKCNCNVPEELTPFIDSWKKKFDLTGNYNKIKYHL